MDTTVLEYLARLEPRQRNSFLALLGAWFIDHDTIDGARVLEIVNEVEATVAA